MARPKKNNADYHTHDKDMRNDLKIKALRKKYGHVGYSIYNMMLEVLDDCDHFQQQWDDFNIELLSGDFDTDATMLNDVVGYCVRLKLFAIDNGFLFSIGHQNRFKALLSKRKRDNSGVIASDNVQTVDGNPHSIVKYSIVKESKEEIQVGPQSSDLPPATPPATSAGRGTDAVASGHPPTKLVSEKKKRRVDNPENVDLVKGYFTEKMNGKWSPARISDNAEKFFNHYSANGWVQSKGKPIVNWKFAVHNWILNEMDGVYSTGSGRSQPASKGYSMPNSNATPPPEERKLSETEKMQLSRDFMEDTYADFCNGNQGILSKNVYSYYYNQLIKDGKLILTQADKDRISKQTGGDIQKSKILAVEEYFIKLRDEGKKTIYDL